MKVFKRDAVIVTVLLFVCVAVYLNWSYNRAEQDVDTAANPSASSTVTPSVQPGSTGTEGEDAGLYYTDTGTDTANTDSALKEYFDGVRLTRQQARDEATETLQVVTATDGASKEAIDTAVEKMTKIADWTVLEAELENLIMAKGFADCVVYIMDDSVSVTVPSQDGGLSSASVAQITDIVTAETEFGASDLKIIEIK